MADKHQTKQSPTSKQTTKQAEASTQAYLNIAEVKDGVIVLKDGSLRAVLMSSAINFALKSGSEQDAIIYAYQRFLNSLTFPVQILIQSRRIDLDYYLDKLSKRADEQDIELIKLQILEYTEFIKRLISVTNIMDKRFFIVVPFFPPETAQQLGAFAKLFATGKPADTKQSDEKFEEYKVQLMQRVEAIASGLGGVGVRAVTLNSEELVELFYAAYNPSTSTKQRLLNVDELTAASIQGGDTAAPPADGAAPASPNYTPVTVEKPSKPPAKVDQVKPETPSGPEKQ